MIKQQEQELLKAFRNITNPEDARYIVAVTQKTAERQINKRVSFRLILGGLQSPNGNFVRKVAGI